MTSSERISAGRSDYSISYSSSSSSSSSDLTGKNKIARPQLDHEKLDVYQIELQFVAWSTDLMMELQDSSEAKKRRIAETCDHLDRASLSALFNTAEGNGKRQMKQRARFFDDARGSATECAACLDSLAAKHALCVDRIEHGKVLLVRIVSMLSKLVDRFSPPDQVREEPAQCRIGIEDEDEDEDEDDLKPISAGRTSAKKRTRAKGLYL